MQCELLPGLTPDQLSRILGALISSTHDYATDNRGDVGSWVRKAALESLESVLTFVQVRLMQPALTFVPVLQDS